MKGVPISSFFFENFYFLFDEDFTIYFINLYIALNVFKLLGGYT